MEGQKVQTESQIEENEDINAIYDEDYDESYDDEILDEVMSENEAEQTETAEPKKSDYKKQNELYVKVIRRYLEKECIRNQYFSEKYRPEYVSSCFDYIMNNVRKNNFCMIQSGKIFELAVSYFDDEIYLQEEEKKAIQKKQEEERKQLEQQKKAALELSKKKEEEKQKKEEEWKKFMEKGETSLSPSELEMEKYKHLKQQELF